MFRRSRKIPSYKRYNSILTFRLRDGSVVNSICHELPLDEVLKEMTVSVGYQEFYHIRYPIWALEQRGDFPGNNIEGTPCIETMLPVAEVKWVVIQRKARDHGA